MMMQDWMSPLLEEDRRHIHLVSHTPMEQVEWVRQGAKMTE